MIFSIKENKIMNMFILNSVLIIKLFTFKCKRQFYSFK